MTPNTPLVTPDVFSEWLLEEQCAYLEQQLSPHTLGSLWALCAFSSDSAPLVHLARLVAARGLPLEGARLLELRPSTLAAVLAVEGLVGSVEQAWQEAHLSHLVSFCLLDRYLRRQRPARWEQLVESVFSTAQDLLRQHHPPNPELLMRLQGSQQRALQQELPQAWREWEPAWSQAAKEAIRILAERPRDVSQANAERLLAQQVYTDPGHFLLELLQNADDAGASYFAVEFGSDALTVRHDGEPFDFRDLVGVLSIGQTTKKSTQIGYFGVGFKSVYEVTERPRLYSGHFAFEIADISVPRALAARPEQHETVLVLPLKRGLDATLYRERAALIEPALLLQVPHLRRILWSGCGPDIEIRLSPVEDDVMVLHDGQRESRLLYWTGGYQHQGERPPGKPDRTLVRLALPLDGTVPTTSLYSFLPIRESSGLNFIVGSHFDVPVDRERLDLSSDWNRGVIATIPDILARQFAADLERGWQLLPSLPLPEDPLGPLFAELPERLTKQLSELPLVPGRLRPRQCRLLAPELEPLFERAEADTVGLAEGATPGLDEADTVGLTEGATPGLDEADTVGLTEGETPGLDEADTAGLAEGATPGLDEADTVGLTEGETPGLDEADTAALLSPGDERRRRWLRQLGAIDYKLDSLLQQLSHGQLPGRLARRQPEDWSRLHGLLMGHSGVNPEQLSTRPEQLRHCPLLLDQDRQPAAPHQVVLLEGEFAELFDTPPRSVHPVLAQLPDSAALLTRLGVPRYDWSHLLEQLGQHGAQAVRLERLFERLLEAPRGVTVACLELPLFFDQNGRPGPLVPPAARRLGVVAAAPGLPLELLPELRCLVATPALERLLDGLRWPRFELSDLVEALEWSALSAQQCELLLRQVEESEFSWTASQLDRLASLSLFEAESGDRLPLSQLWRYQDRELAELLPHRPALRDDSLSARVVQKLGLEHRLSRADLDDLLASLPGTQPERALTFLAARASGLSRSQIERVLSLPLFEGGPLRWPPSEDSPGYLRLQHQPTREQGALAARPEYVELFLGLGEKVLPTAIVQAVMPLLQACAYPLLGLTRLVALLEQRTPPATLLPRLQQLLAQEAAALQLAYSVESRQKLPVWLSRDGRVVRAREVPPSEQLAELTETEGFLRADTPYPAQLDELFPLLDEEAYLRRLLARHARIGQPLSAQPGWCDSVAKVDRLSAYLPLSYLMVNAQDVLCDHGLQQASPLANPWLSRSPLAQELIHPDSAPQQVRDCTPLDPHLVLESYYPLRNEPAMRRAFYAYLQAELGSLAGLPVARRFLLEVAMWRSAGGHWKSLDELLLDPQLPDLGGDWCPHPEIPGSLLSALESVLGVGRPEPGRLLRDYLLPAYLERPSTRAALWPALVRAAQSLETSELRRVLRGPRGEGSFPLPDGQDLLETYHPPEELAVLPALPPTTLEPRAFLRRLGLPYLPPARLLERVRWQRQDGEALLGLVEWAWKSQPEELEPLWETLRSHPWLPARDGQLKLPRQLFLRSAELEELVGSTPELFVSRRVPVGLANRLGLKQDNELDPVLVLQHLRRQVQRGQPQPLARLYAYLEESLRTERLSSFYLLDQLREVPWVWADEGEYRLPEQVLAVPAFRYFGPHRGTWEGAHQRYPRLARLFGIAASVTPRVVLDFLREVHQNPQLNPSPRLLRSCLALLAEHPGEHPSEHPEEQLPRHWKVLPANLAGRGSPRLVSADQPGLVRSNSPTLTALFAGSGRLLVVDPGDAEQGPALDRLYSKLGIPHLRDAYTVKPDRSGREVGPQMAEAVVSFRALLRGLAAVLPRLRAARPRWEEEGEWLEQSRLSHFMNAGTIRVLDQLRLTYELPGVASVAVEAAAAYDPMGHELLLSASAVAQPSLHAVALAEGLLELIYQGPASEGLIDLLNLLIPLGHRQAMDAYLDRRHFPQALSQGQAPGLSERLGEIMDYGLHKLLERRFSELAGQDWAVWRQGDLRLQGDPEAAAQELCRALGQQSPSAELLQTLRQLLAAPTLEEAVGDLWEPATLGSDLRRHDTAAFPAADLDPTDASPGEDRPPGGTTATRAARGSLAQGGAPESAQESASTTGGSHSQAGGGRVTPGPPAAMVTAEGTPGVLASVGQKMLSRLGQWLGVQPQQKVQVLGLRLQLPDVAESYRNPPERHLLVSSKALRGHDLYCPARLGIDFDPRRQIYLPGEVPWLRSFESSGRTLEFSGRLSNAEDPLPMPLYSRLSQPPRIKGGGRATLRGADRMGQYRLTLEDPAAELSYAIELGMLPEPQGQLLPEQIDPRWLKPTAPLNALPPLVLEWISWARSCGLEPAPLARQARDFIISHYIYDKAFLQNPEMLELGRQPVRGDENRILTLLHAGATGRYLGRGVCLELSALLLEMLRRARIPAVLAGVWMLDMGLLHTPDHSIVLACMPGPRGPFWLPLDPSQSRTATAPAQEAPEPTRADLLQAACDLVLGPSFAPPGEPAVREQAQEEALLGALGSRRRLEALLESIARSGRYLREVDSELQWLAARGYLRVDKEELYRVSPRPRGFS